MIKIREALIDDVNEIVVIHCDAFDDFFLTSLGDRFLSFYYSCFIKSDKGIVICIEDGEKIVGFIATTKLCRGFNTNMIKNNLYRFVGLSFELLLFSPKALIRLVRNIKKTKSDIVDIGDYAELYSIAVKKEEQGRGFGKKLLLATEEMLRADGINQLSLTTDCVDNDATIAFYKSMKFDVLYEFVAYPQRKMYRFIKQL